MAESITDSRIYGFTEIRTEQKRYKNKVRRDMTKENKDLLMKLLQQHKALGISDQIDFDKFYLYSIITHSTAIEGSTVTEVPVDC